MKPLPVDPVHAAFPSASAPPVPPPASPRRRRGWRAGGLLLAAAVLLAAGSWLGERRYAEWYYGKHALAPSGGWYFFARVELPVPLYSQGDPRWADQPLGPSDDTIAQTGCALTSAAMVLRFYGADTDPGRLNDYLDHHGGYTPQGWLYWEKAAEVAGGQVRHAYEDLPSYELIDANLRRGNPVIVRIRLPAGITHFVVVMGKEGFDYLIRDPAGPGRRRGVYPLKDYGRPIEALRFYEKVRSPAATTAGP